MRMLIQKIIYFCSLWIVYICLIPYDAHAQTATFTPTPFLYSSASSLVFSATAQGSYQDKIVTLRNIGGSDLTIYDLGFQITGSSNAYSLLLDANNCLTEAQIQMVPLTIASGLSVCLKVRFAPTTQTDITNLLEIYHTGTALPKQILLSGTAIVPTPTFTPTSTSTPTITTTPTPTPTPDKTGPSVSPDPYVCGGSIHGKAIDSGGAVTIVRVILYQNSTQVRDWNTNINNIGYFEIPIDYNNNNSIYSVTEGTYRIVFVVRDNAGNETQSDYVAFITNRCSATNSGQSQNNTSSTNSSSPIVQYIPQPVVTIYQQIKYLIYPTPTPIVITRVLIQQSPTPVSSSAYYQPAIPRNEKVDAQVEPVITKQSFNGGLTRVGAGALTATPMKQQPSVTAQQQTHVPVITQHQELLRTAGLPWYIWLIGLIPVGLILFGVLV